MVPDAGFADIVAGVVPTRLPAVDVSAEIQSINLECTTSSEFMREISRLRGKYQRWVSGREEFHEGGPDRDIDVAKIVYGSLLDAASLEGIDEVWFEYLARYLSKQCAAMHRLERSWYEGRSDDLKRAIDGFIENREKLCGGTRAKKENTDVAISWLKLDVVEAAPWSFPTDSCPYRLIRERIQNAIEIYGLRGKAEVYYIMRNFAGALKSELEMMIRTGLQRDHQTPEFVVQHLWEYLDKRFKNSLTISEMVQRWESLKQQDAERVESFFARVEMESVLVVAMTGRAHSDLDKCIRARAGMHTRILDSLESMGPTVESLSFEELRRSAIYFESRQMRRMAGKEKRKDPIISKQGVSSVPQGENSKSSSNPARFNGICSRCQQPGHTWKFCQAARPAGMNRRCGICGLGHLTKDCRLGTKAATCKRCGKSGHLQYVCPNPLPSGQVTRVMGKAVESNGSSSKHSTPAFLVEIGCQDKASTPVTSAEPQPGIDGAVCSVTPFCAADLGCVDRKMSGTPEKLVIERDALSLSLLSNPDTVRISIAGEYYEALVDTGAAVAMVRASEADGLSIKCPEDVKIVTVKPIVVTCANGTARIVRRECVLRCYVGESRSEVLLPLLMVNELSHPVILGRAALRILGARLIYTDEEDTAVSLRDQLREFLSGDGDSSVNTIAAVEISAAPVIELAQVEATLQEDEYRVNPLERGDAAGEFNKPFKDFAKITSRDPFEAEISKALDGLPLNENFLDAALQRIYDHGVFEVPDAQSYQLSLKKLCEIVDPNGYVVKDTDDQQYRFLVDWPLSSTRPDQQQSRGSWRPDSLIRKLSPVQKEKWDAELKMYFDRQWWCEAGLRPGQDPKVEWATCFPVCSLSDSKTTPVRPCLDFRGYNSKSPRCSSRRRSVQRAVRELRAKLYPQAIVEQMDASKAFYRIAVNKILYIDCGRSDLSNSLKATNRLAFGLAIGPNALESIGDILFAILRAKFPMVEVVRVMDDYLIISPNSKVRSMWNRDMIALFSKVGFELPESKRSLWGHSEDQFCRWLGADWKWDPKGVLSVRRLPIENGELQTTRRGIFAVAGRYLDITRSAGEAQCRAHCDVARQIAGRCTGNWDDEIDSKAEQSCRKHLQAAEMIWQQLNGAVPIIKGAKNLRIAVDASNSGYGIEIWVPAAQLASSVELHPTGWVSVYAESKLFPYGCTWHANRRELYGILMAFIAVIDQMQSEWWDSLKSIEICSDSLVSIRRMRSSSHKIHGIEQLSIARLRSSIDEAVEELRLLGVGITFSHHSHNSFYINRVDILSRISEDLPPSNILTNIDCEVDEFTSYEVPIMASDVIDFHYPYSLLIPTIESIPLLQKFLTLYESFQAWRGRGPTDLSEVVRRFLIKQQDCDPQAREAKKVLESSMDPNSFKASLPPSLYHYIRHCILLNGVLCKVESWDEDESLKIVLPRPTASSLLEDLTNYYHHVRGHVGVDATYRHLRKVFWAPALRKSVKGVVRSCAACLVTAPLKKLRHESHLKCPSSPFEVIGCDLVGPLVPGAIQTGGSSGARWILTVTDLLSRYCLLFPLSDISTSSICKVLEREVFLVYRAPATLITDLGSNLISYAFDALCAYYACTHLTLPVRHPSSGGFYEVAHLHLVRCLRRCLQGRKSSSWPELLRLIQASMNNTIDEATGLTPHHIVFGFDAVLPFENMLMSSLPQQALTIDSIKEYMSYPNETRCGVVLNAVKKLEKSRQRMTKNWRDEWRKRRSATVGPVIRPIYEIGRKVLVYQPVSHKLDAMWVPGVVTRHLGKECVEVKFSDGSVQVYHKDHIKDDSGLSQTQDPRLRVCTSLPHNKRTSGRVGRNILGDTVKRVPSRSLHNWVIRFRSSLLSVRLRATFARRPKFWYRSSTHLMLC